MIVLAFLILFLLSWMFIISGSEKAPTYSPTTTVLKELLIVGTVFVLLCITVSVGKTYLWDMTHRLPPTIRHFW